ncbi:MAG: hypothetical protein KBT57_01370, partial [bacterium]|nr:hypothetical protein [Candidatus Limimorpha equi]
MLCYQEFENEEKRTSCRLKLAPKRAWNDENASRSLSLQKNLIPSKSREYFSKKTSSSQILDKGTDELFNFFLFHLKKSLFLPPICGAERLNRE